MNTNIKTIMKESGCLEYLRPDITPHGGAYVVTEEMLETFAHLLIKSCATVAHTSDGDGVNASVEILNHFGWEQDMCDCDLDAKDECELCTCGLAGYWSEEDGTNPN